MFANCGMGLLVAGKGNYFKTVSEKTGRDATAQQAKADHTDALGIHTVPPEVRNPRMPSVSRWIISSMAFSFSFGRPVTSVILLRLRKPSMLALTVVNG